MQTSITTDLSSDHCGQLVALKCKVVKQVNKSSVFVPVNKKRMVRFRHNIGKRLPLLPVGTTVDTQYNNLSDCINKEFNTIFTPKKVSHSQCKSFSDWATAGIYKSRQRLYDLYAEKSYNHTEEFILYVRNYSKLFKKVCYAAKSLNIKNKIKNSTNKTKMTWKIIDSETGRVRDRNQDIELCVDNTIIKSNEEIAIVFDKYFSDIPISTTKSLQSSPALAESLLKDNVNECKVSFSFRPIGADDIVRIFRTIDIKNTTDLWGISVKIISSIIDVIAPHLAIIFNNCIKSGEFPDLMKHSKVIPLFKAGSMSDPSNFRPISVLPTCSKIFEKIILNQLVSHFNVNKLLHNNQFGFTKGRSTADAGVELYRYIVKAWEESHDALGVFCDLSKAFDCVQHETLIGKLRHYGIKNTALNLLTSYLHGRTQKVEVNGKRSSGSAVDMGVPQGSILGPFLFLVYINDLPFMVERKHQKVLFADDTSLIFKIKRQITNFDDVNNALSSIVHWFSMNNLLLNAKKTKCIKFCAKNARVTDTRPIINGEELNLDDTTVFLGITMDSKLQWSPHINGLAKRLSSAAYAVTKIRSLTDVDTARLVYFSYFHSLMTYGLLLWGHAADVETIFILQKRAIRAIYNLKCRESLRDKFKEINILTFPSQYIYENIMYVYKNSDKFTRIEHTHNVNTRNKRRLQFPRTRLSKVSNSFLGKGYSSLIKSQRLFYHCLSINLRNVLKKSCVKRLTIKSTII
ncbi:unnamed protein product [Pieris macdunnoughi]|uniref:Reverse transcriptase domain-containing protein n=1 Tax=Pieris macdunnoughi TaxID=345717 RepID=A0A821XH04_9NEOP|nr:unnamed protein product [Pieris macdunnoughi]